MSGGFKRSSWFGLGGVFVVAALAIVIATTMGQGEANPKPALGLIFGLIAIFFVVLFALQRSDLERAAGGGHQVENPTTMAEPELWAALAVAPIDADAIRARDEVWDVSRRSLRLGMVIVGLIFLTVPSIYLFETFLPLLIGGPLIAIAALYGSFRTIGPGGEIDQGFERTDRAMAPLGLRVTQRPKGGFEVRSPTMPGFDYRLRGATELSGERHGRAVSVRLGGHEEAGMSEVTVASPGPEFSARSRDGRIRAAEGAPEAVVTALAAVPNSVRWKRVSVDGGPAGIVITRKKGEQRDWLCDLWLAERLAA